MSPTYTNRHGRIPGRGLRGWLIVPKVIGASAVFGGLVAMAAIALTPDATAYPIDETGQVAMLRRVWLHVVLPGFGLAAVCGWALLLQHLKVFARQRWVWAKAVSGWLLVVAIATSGYLVWREAAVVDATLKGVLFASIAAAAMVIYFGRQKPRLGRKAAT